MSTHAAHAVAKSIHRLADFKQQRDFLLRETTTELSRLSAEMKQLHPNTVYVLNNSQVLTWDSGAWCVKEARQV